MEQRPVYHHVIGARHACQIDQVHRETSTARRGVEGAIRPRIGAEQPRWYAGYRSACGAGFDRYGHDGAVGLIVQELLAIVATHRIRAAVPRATGVRCSRRGDQPFRDPHRPIEVRHR